MKNLLTSNPKIHTYRNLDSLFHGISNFDGYFRPKQAMDCRIVVREFVLQSRYYIHFRTNTLGKGMNPIILPAMG